MNINIVERQCLQTILMEKPNPGDIKKIQWLKPKAFVLHYNKNVLS